MQQVLLNVPGAIIQLYKILFCDKLIHRVIPYKAPKFNEKAFNCPFCNAYAHQNWEWAYLYNRTQISDLKVARCGHCGEYSLWVGEKMVYPSLSTAPLPNLDLDPEIKGDFLEAREILSKSPRGAAALLRLCLQKLMKQLGKKGENLNDDIKSLVKEGLSVKVAQALEVVRVIGNNAVHPGQVDIKDDHDTALRLFELVNLIAESMISEPKRVDELYKKLPQEEAKK